MTILITGASRGLGAQLARLYAEAGDSVIGTVRQAQPAPPPNTRFLPLDVTSAADQARLAKDLSGHAIDTLVCNAGVYLDKGHQLETGYDADLWTQTFAVNVTGVFLTIQHLLPNLHLAKAPKIAILSSMMASQARAPGGSYIYRSSKAAVLNLGRNLATDLRPEGIAVGIYEPGWVQTDMGGANAPLTPETAGVALKARIDALSMANSGCFQSPDGSEHPY